MTNTKVAVVGSGYVGMSIAAMLARLCAVVVLDIDQCRVDKVNQGLSSIDDPDMDQFINNNNFNLRATLDQDDAYKGAHFIIIAVPTDYDAETNKFDTKAVDAAVADALSSNESALIVIKSISCGAHSVLTS
jgi:UDPglucose 6-dehydrogenase